MARWKTLQSKQWREENNTSAITKSTLPSIRLRRAYQQTAGKSKSVDFDLSAHNSVVLQVAPFLCPTAHAKLRMAQRNLSNEEVSYVLLYGQSWHKAGATITYLREKDMPFADQAEQKLQRLIGAIVVTTTDSDRVILTAYRNRRSGLRNIKHKSDYGW